MIRPRRRPPSPARPALLAGALVSAGVLHGMVPRPFDTIVPPWLPGPARFDLRQRRRRDRGKRLPLKWPMIAHAWRVSREDG